MNIYKRCGYFIHIFHDKYSFQWNCHGNYFQQKLSSSLLFKGFLSPYVSTHFYASALSVSHIHYSIQQWAELTVTQTRTRETRGRTSSNPEGPLWHQCNCIGVIIQNGTQPVLCDVRRFSPRSNWIMLRLATPQGLRTRL